MRSTRPQSKTEEKSKTFKTVLKENILNSIESTVKRKKFPELSDGTTSSVTLIEEPSIHCHIPVCIDKPIVDVKLAALVTALKKKGYDYTIYLAPRETRPDDKVLPLEAWKEK